MVITGTVIPKLPILYRAVAMLFFFLNFLFHCSSLTSLLVVLCICILPYKQEFKGLLELNSRLHNSFLCLFFFFLISLLCRGRKGRKLQIGECVLKIHLG